MENNNYSPTNHSYINYLDNINKKDPIEFVLAPNGKKIGWKLGRDFLNLYGFPLKVVTKKNVIEVDQYNFNIYDRGALWI